MENQRNLRKSTLLIRDALKLEIPLQDIFLNKSVLIDEENILWEDATTNNKATQKNVVAGRVGRRQRIYKPKATRNRRRQCRQKPRVGPRCTYIRQITSETEQNVSNNYIHIRTFICNIFQFNILIGN